MKKIKKYYLHLEPWYFIVALVSFHLITLLVSEIKMKENPESVSESSFPVFEGEFSEEGYNFIFFYNSESGISNKMRYNVEQMAGESEEDIYFFEVDVNKTPDYITEFNVSAVPNLLVFKDNKELMRIMGVVPESNLQRIKEKIRNL